MTARSDLLRVAVILVILVLGIRPAACAQDPVQAEIRLRIEWLRDAGAITVAGQTFRASGVLAEMYWMAAHTPIWTDPAAARELTRAIAASWSDGLEPEDYHLSAIEALAANGGSSVVAADLDLLRTDALLRLTHDLRFGKVNSVDPSSDRNTSRSIGGTNAAEELLRMVGSGRLEAEIAALRPAHFTYEGLRSALAELRGIAANGGWDAIPSGPALRATSVDPRVAMLRRRLAGEGGATLEFDTGDNAFDAQLEAAVKSFQHRHGLNEDGIVGPATLAELNVPIATRIEQLRINLERARWFTHDLPNTFVAVNIAGARVYLVREGSVVHEARVIVGQTSTRTPVFQASMQYIDLNPTWTVPASIVPEILAEVRRDPDYLGRNGMRVIDSEGRPVPVTADELAGYSARNFPYTFRQDPGPLNALGQIKLMFPNPFNVYLHDTPAKGLFEREQRTFSHGCIRVQDPIRLAELILDDSVRWSYANILSAIESGNTRRIPLLAPIPVLILYWTASTDLHGELHFYRDVYGRDAGLLAALDARS